MRRPAHRSVDVAVERGGGDRLGPVPIAGHRPAPERAVAGEAELASGIAPGALEHHAADRRRVSGVADSVEHDLGDRTLAVERLARGFVIDRGRQAIERAGAVGGGSAQMEGPRRGIGLLRHRNGGVHRQRGQRIDLAQGGRAGLHGHRLDLGDFGRGRLGLFELRAWIGALGGDPGHRGQPQHGHRAEQGPGAPMRPEGIRQAQVGPFEGQSRHQHSIFTVQRCII